MSLTRSSRSTTALAIHLLTVKSTLYQCVVFSTHAHHWAHVEDQTPLRSLCVYDKLLKDASNVPSPAMDSMEDRPPLLPWFVVAGISFCQANKGEEMYPKRNTDQLSTITRIMSKTCLVTIHCKSPWIIGTAGLQAWNLFTSFLSPRYRFKSLSSLLSRHLLTILNDDPKRAWRDQEQNAQRILDIDWSTSRPQMG